MFIIIKKVNFISLFKKIAPEVEYVETIEPLKEMPKSEQLAFWNDFIEDYPNSTKAYKQRGDIYRKLKKWQLAIADYDRSIQIQPHYSFSYLSRGLVWAELNEKEKAIKDLKNAQRLMKKENNLVGYESVGFFLKDLGLAE